PPVEFNNIFGNTTYNAKVVGPENRSAQNNWWGTTDPAEIDEKIYDGLDDPMLGLLDYLPFLTEPYEEGPIVTSVAPSSRGQGATGQDIIVTGTNFMDGADVSFSGDGITVNSTTFVSDTELVANIDIASDAPVGFRDVIVTNPDSQTGIGEDIFSVTAAPTVTSTNPDSLPQGSEDQYVMIEGSGFVDNLPDDPNGPQLAADFGDGITVNSVAYFNSTVLIASISIAEDAAVGARDVTVVNGDAGVGVGVGIFTVVEPSELTLVCKTDKEIYNPWESVQVLADVDNPGSSFDANLLGGIIVVRTPPKKTFILKGEVVTETIHPGANPDILLYTSKPIITAIAPKVTHGAFSVLYTQEDGILAIDTSTWGLTAPPDVAQEKFFDKLIRSYIDKYGVENLQNANAEEALASPANAPSQTALGSAFPNSANPETWFPFQLSEPSEVTIEIYNASGQLVKTLDFGYKEAGYYLNKEKAAFWNGRNDRGERVASGIYFYTMQTRNFTATKKVVILK
ncbi:MAG: FlgD immunoglobulin-like domain containing protein, partial [Candidatus Poribacteria bacterium]